MFLSQQDMITGLVAAAIITITLVLVLQAIRRQVIKRLHGRQLLHGIAICTCAAVIARFDNLRLLAVVFVSFAIVLALAQYKGWLPLGAPKSVGIPLFPLAFSVLLLWPGLDRQVIVLAVLILGISDAAAAWFGSRFAKRHFPFLYEPKSWLGFLVFFITAFITTLIFIQSWHPAGWLFCCLFALVPALTELFSYRGSDNATVPFMAVLWYYLLQDSTPTQLTNLALFSILLLILSFAAVYKKWLLPGGAAAAVWMGLLCFAVDGYRALALPTLFFLIGSLLSKLNKEKQEKEGRSAVQVFANGMVGTVCLVLYQLVGQELYLLAAMMSFAISMSDTVSAEAGKYWKGRTWDIITLQPVATGLSGGVSLIGTVAGLLGAFVLALVAGWLYHLSVKHMALITGVGFMGMIADSILGSRCQALYRRADGVFTEEESGNILVKGWGWCTNHTVNLLSNTLVISIIILIFCGLLRV